MTSRASPSGRAGAAAWRGQHRAVTANHDTALCRRIRGRRAKPTHRAGIRHGHGRGVGPGKRAEIVAARILDARRAALRRAFGHTRQRRFAVFAHRIEARAGRHLDRTRLGCCFAHRRHVGQIADHRYRAQPTAPLTEGQAQMLLLIDN
jgi:hypothetical protein